MKKLLLLPFILSALTTPVLSHAGPFIINGPVPHVMQQPLSVNPERSEICHGTILQCPNGLPLAEPRITSVGIISAFLATNMSQANPNSPMPALSNTCAKWVWSGKDNTGWVCTAIPSRASAPQQPVQHTPQQTAVCTQMLVSIHCTVNGRNGGLGTANGQPACFVGNSATIQSTGQTLTCTSYN